MPKERRKKVRRDPLLKAIKKAENPGILRAPRRTVNDLSEEEEEAQLTPVLSKKIMLQAEAQQKETDDLKLVDDELPQRTTTKLISLQEEEQEEELLENEDLDADYQELNMVISEEDQKALALFMPQQQAAPRRTLADIIMVLDAINQKESTQPGQKKMDSKVVSVYRRVGRLLSFYRSGKVPKAFKIIPSLKDWESVLFLTEPDKWTANATFVATKLFVANVNEKMAQRFFSLVLVNKVKDDLEKHPKLNFHLYQAIKKAVLKPGAFFRGIILPLAEEGCTLREAVIIGSILSKCSLPVAHSSATLLKLCQLPYSGVTCYLIKVLLNKKYNLPYRVIDALVSHFASFVNEERTLPVLWHSSLLIFVQRYKFEFTKQQKDIIRSVLRAKNHYLITPEIRKELALPDQPQLQQQQPMLF